MSMVRYVSSSIASCFFATWILASSARRFSTGRLAGLRFAGAWGFFGSGAETGVAVSGGAGFFTLPVAKSMIMMSSR